MPDWNLLVCQRLRSLEVNRAQRDDIIAELAGHLADRYEQLCAQGISESDAIEQSMQEVNNWDLLARQIRRAKRQEETMGNRIKHLWLPGSFSVAATTAWLVLLYRAGAPVQRLGSMPVLLYVPWLVALPCFGAAAAYLSRRTGGARVTRIIAALLPAILAFGFGALALLSSLVVEPNVFILHHPAYLGFGFFSWIVLPASGLLLGATPFLATNRSPES